MIGPVLPASTFVAYADGFDSGLVGTIAVTIYDPDGNVVVARTTAGIIELAAVDDASRYRFSGTAPAALDEPYLLVWDDGTDSSSEELLVSATSDSGGTSSVTFPWVDGEQVAECLGISYTSDNADALELAAEIASDLLFGATGAQFLGERGPVEVRPVTRPECNVIELAGYPVRAVLQVKIDGDVIESTHYRLERRRLLRYLGDTATGGRRYWPTHCNRVDLPNSEQGTFSVTYTYGADIPAVGIEAAKLLGAEVYNACIGSDDCALPSGVVQVIRQGVTINRVMANQALWDGIGIPVVDMFVNRYNPSRRTRRAAVWSPETRFPRRVG